MIGKRSKQTKRNPKAISTEFETNTEPKRGKKTSNLSYSSNAMNKSSLKESQPKSTTK